MQASNGAFTHESIMRLPWRLFGVYLDAFTYIQREQTEDGRIDNQKDDLKAMSGNETIKNLKKKLVEDTKAKTKKFVERHEAGVKVKTGSPKTLNEIIP